jgi:hypothetical protein
MVANRKEKTPSNNGGKKLLNEQSQQDCADGRECEIVYEKQRLQLERLAIPHQFSSPEDNRVVDRHEDRGLLQRRHGRLPSHESEVIGGVAGE